MKRLISCLFVLAFSMPAFGAQVDPDEYVKEHYYYGRSDGLYQRKDTKTFDLITNGARTGGVVDRHGFYEDFSEYGDGDMFCIQDDWTACQGAAGAENFVYFPSGNRFVTDAIVGQTVLGSVDMDAGSLDIAGDQTDDDGLELYWGFSGADGMPFIIGSSPAFYTCANVTVADVSGTDDFHIGFRAAVVMNATFDNYTDLASIGPISGNITIETILNNAATTTTDTTADAADASNHDYCVYVSAAGVVTYTVDGSTPPTTAAFTFDDGDAVIPFIHLLQDADLTGEVDLYEWEVGYSG